METYRRTFFQSLANGQTQIVINAALDQGDHINCFENIVHDAWVSLVSI